MDLPFVEKYRPKLIDNIYGHTDIKKTLKNLLKKKNIPHLLLHGPPGTGKTSIIMACARELYGDQVKLHVLELNASDERGINTVRDRIKQFASTAIFFSNKTKLVILDEADMMTSDAQLALRCIIEKYTSNTRFCIICNYITNVIDALQSRCMKFVFKPIENKFIEKKGEQVIKSENINISKGALKQIINYAQGDMRKMLNSLDTIQMFNQKKITEKDILNITDTVPDNVIKQIEHTLLNRSYSESYNYIYSLCKNNAYLYQNIITKLSNNILNVDLKESKKINILIALSDLENDLASVNENNLHLGQLVSLYLLNR